ncbi:long-chain fatty acid-CoA ligase [Marasmius sp. AFHP31]|nr:long-chain fatty acid-CoA ligase [Marasmius sp. AFHP31]
MTDGICSIPGNPDIAGIGVRASVYAQACLAISVSAFSLLRNEQRKEELVDPTSSGLLARFLARMEPYRLFSRAALGKPIPDSITSSHIRIVNTFERGIFMVGFAAIISAIIESRTSNGLTPYHSLIILNIGFINSWAGSELVFWSQFLAQSEGTRRSAFWSWYSLHSILFGAFGFYFWARKSAPVNSYITDPNTGHLCQPLTYLWVFGPVSVTNPTLKAISLTFYALAFIPGIALILYTLFLYAIVFAIMPLIFFLVLLNPVQVLFNSLLSLLIRILLSVAAKDVAELVRGYRSRYHSRFLLRIRPLNRNPRNPTIYKTENLLVAIFRIIFRGSPVIYTIVSTEYTVQINSANVTARENDWTYGQTLALLTALVAIALQLKEWLTLLKEERRENWRRKTLRFRKPPGDIEMGKVDLASLPLTTNGRTSTNIPGYYGEGSVEIAPLAGPNEGGVRRLLAISSAKLISQPFEGINTLYDIIPFAARTHGERKAMGWRNIVGTHEEEEVKKNVGGEEVTEKKKWKYFELSDYQYINYIELENAVSEVARGLVKLGVSTDHVFNISSCASDLHGLEKSLQEPKCIGIFTSAELLPTLHDVLEQTRTVKYIIYDGKPSDTLTLDLHNVREDIEVYSIDGLRIIGKSESSKKLASRCPKPNTTVCIMYTCGSTGAPKGVVISHGNLIASMGAVYVLLGHHLTHDDSYFTHIPPANMIAYIFETIMLFVSVPIGYSLDHTLPTNASLHKCKEDFASFRPSIIYDVPPAWESIRKGILSKVQGSRAVKKAMFNGAMTLKENNVPVLAQIANTLVLSRFRAATGGRLRIALSCGAALSQETQMFLDKALVLVLQGYGMMETCGMCIYQPPEYVSQGKYGNVGLLIPSTEIKLLDVKEAGYTRKNNPPQGEVWIRGNSLAQDYFKQPDPSNDESEFIKDEDGKVSWLRTGDVGQWNSNGTLTIIDHVKNLIKLSCGRYVALGKLESTYRSCNLVSELCVHAFPGAKQPIAIIFPHKQHLRHTLASGNTGVNFSKELAELCKDPMVSALVLKECDAVGKKNGLEPHGTLSTVILTKELEDGLLTPINTVQRKNIVNRFKEEVNKAYKDQ